MIIAGSPLVLLRLGAAGVRIARALEAGDDLPPGHAALTDRLLDIGAIHPVPPTASAAAAMTIDLTVVVPARDVLPRFRSARFRTVLVDDASPLPLAPNDAELGDLTVERLAVNAGPGAARTAGLAAVRTELVAFVDTDVECTDDDLVALAGHFTDPRVALVAPRVLAPDDAGTALERYERARSPLDLGPEAARVAAGTRVAYVPAALIVCRTDALRQVGAFDPTLRYGEDVDLVWRLREAGWRCRYEPAVVVHHRTRPHLRAWLAQRYHYGTSAAPLAARHPGALAPVRTNGWSVVVWGTLVMGHPVVATALAAGTARALVRRLPDVPPRESRRLAAMGHLWAGRLFASTWVRAWWPVAAAAAIVSRRGRRWLALAFAAQAVEAVRSAPRPAGPRDAAERIVLRMLDDGAYGAGVWVGALRARQAAALLPALTAWPARRRRSGARTGT